MDQTATHYRAIGVDYGWPDTIPLIVDLWVPHNQEAPQDWLDMLWSVRGCCDCCGVQPPLRFSGPHNAYFCPECYARENG